VRLRASVRTAIAQLRAALPAKSHAGVAQLRAWIDVLWDDVLDNFTEAARKEHDQ
jgi:hypothetical protein